MDLYTVRRSLRRLIYRRWKGFVVCIVLLMIWDTFWVAFPSRPDLATLSTRPPSGERYFIASIHWNNEIILRSNWMRAVVDLVKFLGPENTFTSVLESGSWDDSKGALRILEEELKQLNAPHNIVLDETTHQDEISRQPGPQEPGWIWTPREMKELRRIPYLSRLRNTVMDDMMKANDTQERPFTKVLWLNDVVFTTMDILTLLQTRSGDYAAACSLDFSKPPKYYDTFALRDSSGNKAITQTWPYFLSSASRRALIGNKPVPVQSCWNGVVAMDAQPFYNKYPLRFRGVSDSLALHHLEGSECCLIHADNPLSMSKGVWLNPNVRVGYNPDAYHEVDAFTNTYWPSFSLRMKGLWKNRLISITNAPKRIIETLVVRSRMRTWRSARPPAEPERVEKGTNCLINEMQVLVDNGWKHL